MRRGRPMPAIRSDVRYGAKAPVRKLRQDRHEAVPIVSARCLAPGHGRRRRGLDGDARELFDRGQAGPDLGDAVVPERAHALLDRGALDLLAAGVLRRERRQLLAHLEQLEDADPALVAGLVAPRTALLAIEGH